ncbi:sigma-70 family RNA polymerase sigma factor [Niabella pedocola]|uniref:Sigma-70 family RNA polymerase sigma factor n=1 Tax=Niabella pedocola TaxID=1752077 RepID=A0ABS8PVV4_9BACT|nr:sigma-70 family RNA polymerase sigma factor [Niabella pedocola]MBO9592145.1 sigma-70 family RNA polymerase sigma factor [Niabella sp.]MCD2425202.1 sigma-70 family RNA polymerase sigma factor [Niabella pedocola]
MANKEFNELLVDNADFLKPFAVNLTKNSESANDLYQETLYKALANSEKYNSGTNIKAWLFTIMRNIFINDYRRNVKRKTILDSTPEDYLINMSQVSVANTAESSLREKEINAAIEGLPETFKVPFRLYFEGYKYQEIAEYLKEPLGTIKSRIHFARKLLKEQIRRY